MVGMRNFHGFRSWLEGLLASVAICRSVWHQRLVNLPACRWATPGPCRTGQATRYRSRPVQKPDQPCVAQHDLRVGSNLLFPHPERTTGCGPDSLSVSVVGGLQPGLFCLPVEVGEFAMAAADLATAAAPVERSVAVGHPAAGVVHLWKDCRIYHQPKRSWGVCQHCGAFGSRAGLAF